MDANADFDAALTARLAADLDGSFEALVGAHVDRLYSIALRILGDRRDAEEAAQDALVRAFRALAGYEDERIRQLRLRPWLTTIVVNVCRNRTRVESELSRRNPSHPGPVATDVDDDRRQPRPQS